MSTRSANEPMNVVSVIIPTHNRRDKVQLCLEALMLQTVERGTFDVVVVDDGSIDGTYEMLRSWIGPFRLHPVRQSNGGPAKARNTGVAASSGRWCLFLDDDIVAQPNLIAEHLRVHLTVSHTVTIGRIATEIPAAADWITKSFAAGWQRRNERIRADDYQLTGEDCFSGNLAMSREDFLRIGGFATDMRRGHDVELGYKLQASGLTLRYLYDAVGIQHEEKSGAELLRDARLRGSASAELLRRHPETIRNLSQSYRGVGVRLTLLRWMFLTFRIPVRPLAVLGVFAVNHPRMIRFAGFLHDYCYWRGLQNAVDRRTWTRITNRTPILMYHAFDASPIGTRFVMPRRRFRTHLRILRLLRYQGISLEDYLDEPELAGRRVVLTIDDGYRDSYLHALPLLRKYGFGATVFLVTGRIGMTSDWDSAPDVSGREILALAEIEEMRRSGIRFGAHTLTHPRLTELTRQQAAEEIKTSVANLEMILQEPISTFAYPYGDHDQQTRSLVDETGLVAACGVESGFNSIGTPANALRRIEVFGTDSALNLLFKLLLGRSGKPPAGNHTALVRGPVT